MTQGSKPVCRKTFRKVTHCIFDLDGTILDSEVMYHNTVRQICTKYGKLYTKALQLRMYGLTDQDVCLAVTKELRLPISPQEFQLQLNHLAATMLPKAPLQIGVERLLTHFHHYKIPMALATNSSASCVKLHSTARPKLFAMFHHKVSATDPEVHRGKPSPDMFIVAASRFPEKPMPGQCLVFEDSIVGVQAAKDAGMQVVMVPAPHMNTHNYTRNATLVIRSLLHFKPELFGLPPFKKNQNV